MVSTYRKFKCLLLLEIESLRDEVQLILESLDLRLERHEITDYVRNENGAILRNELLGLEDFLRNQIDLAERDDATLDEVVAEVRAYLRKRLVDRDYVPALYELLNRRISKIVAYLSEPVSASR